PAEVVRLAHERGVTTLALTDHDSTDGLVSAIATGGELGVRVIPGIELSTDLPSVSIHVLGLFLDFEDAAFQERVRSFRKARLTRAQQMVDKLTALGAPIALHRVFEIAGEGSVGRPHVAQALLEAGHVQSIEEAFEKYIGRSGPAYFEGFRLTPAEGVQLIHQVGGLAAWAHPNELDGRDWRDYLPALVDAGVDALEVYYSKDYGPDVPRMLLEACARHDLLPTVGSDFHGFASMDHPPGSVAAPNDLLSRLEARLALR
ncbi:MAG TPA: phosphatase, partial [Chloroflexota bacterium]|nr:phosphatase [Chloroflexota bacterium]